MVGSTGSAPSAGRMAWSFGRRWTGDEDLLEGHRRRLSYVLGLSRFACALGGYALARRGLRPIEWVTATTRRIGPTALITPTGVWVGREALRLSLTDVVAGIEDAADDPTAGELGLLAFAARESESPLERLEHALHPCVGFLIMPLFALANAGVHIEWKALTEPVSSGVAVALFVGKPVGVVLFSFLAVQLGVAKLPEGELARTAGRRVPRGHRVHDVVVRRGLGLPGRAATPHAGEARHPARLGVQRVGRRDTAGVHLAWAALDGNCGAAGPKVGLRHAAPARCTSAIAPSPTTPVPRTERFIYTSTTPPAPGRSPRRRCGGRCCQSWWCGWRPVP